MSLRADGREAAIKRDVETKCFVISGYRLLTWEAFQKPFVYSSAD